VNGSAPDGVRKRPSQASDSDSITNPDESKPSVNIDPNQTSEPPLPSPKAFFPHFINYTDHFIRFLEEVSTKRWGSSNSGQDVVGSPDLEDRKAVLNTLLELYLTPTVTNPDGL
jgi:hypothetical protein